MITTMLFYDRVKPPPGQAIHYLREYHFPGIHCGLLLREDYTMSRSSNRKEPVLNVNDYSARHYPPENSQRPDSSDITLYNLV